MKFAVTGFISILSKHAPDPEIEHPAAHWNWADPNFYKKSEFGPPYLEGTDHHFCLLTDLNFYGKSEFYHHSWKELTIISASYLIRISM